MVLERGYQQETLCFINCVQHEENKFMVCPVQWMVFNNYKPTHIKNSSSAFMFMSRSIYTIDEPHQKTGTDVKLSHPLLRMFLYQYQASSLGMTGERGQLRMVGELIQMVGSSILKVVSFYAASSSMVVVICDHRLVDA